MESTGSFKASKLEFPNWELGVSSKETKAFITSNHKVYNVLYFKKLGRNRRMKNDCEIYWQYSVFKARNTKGSLCETGGKIWFGANTPPIFLRMTINAGIPLGGVLNEHPPLLKPIVQGRFRRLGGVFPASGWRRIVFCWRKVWRYGNKRVSLHAKILLIC